MSHFRTLTGGCHCRRVRFEAQVTPPLTAQSCNCSICAMSGFVHLIVPGNHFHLLSGEAELVEYGFNTGVARHLFCGHCGVKSFYVPRSNPDGFSINVRCLDPGLGRDVTIEAFDGQNWEVNAHSLSHLA